MRSCPDDNSVRRSRGLKTRRYVQHVAGRVAQGARSEAPTGYQIETGGLAPFYNRFNEVSRQDLEKAERLAFPITLLVLVLAFGTLIAAGLPILLGIFSLVVTLGALYFLAGVTNMSVYVTNTASIIGIGAGVDCDGQVLVLHDVLGLYGEFKPKFAKRYADIGAAVTTALQEFDREVRDGSFPTAEHSFTMKESELLSLQRSLAQQKAG